MNEYIFYTNEGFTYSPRDSKMVENCQVLGRSEGYDAAEAEKSLLEENPWIVECGFDMCKIIREQIVNESLQQEVQQNKRRLEFLTNLLDKRQLQEYEEWVKDKE
mgnify:CR=1 FL=1